MDGHSGGLNYATIIAGHLGPRRFIKNVQGPYLARQLLVFRTSALTSKFLCAHSGLYTIFSVGARFILVWAECPYIQSSAARAIDTIVAQCS
jgi:hypothetical protein